MKRDCFTTHRILGARCCVCGERCEPTHMPTKVRGLYCRLDCPVCSDPRQAELKPEDKPCG